MLADEAVDMALLEQLIIFVKYVGPVAGEARREFVATKFLDSPSGANAVQITGKILNVLQECYLQVGNLKLAMAQVS